MEEFDKISEEIASELIDAFKALEEYSKECNNEIHLLIIRVCKRYVEELDKLKDNSKTKFDISLNKYYNAKWYNKWYYEINKNINLNKYLKDSGRYFLAEKELNNYIKYYEKHLNI